MKYCPYSFDKAAEGRGSLRSLAVPALIAAVLAGGLVFAAIKWLRPEHQPPAQWQIQWVELPDFKKQNDATKEKKK